MTAQAQWADTPSPAARSELAADSILKGLASRGQEDDLDRDRFRSRLASAFGRFEEFDSAAARPKTEASERAQRSRARMLFDAKMVMLEALDYVDLKIGLEIPSSDDEAAMALERGLSEMQREIDDIRNAIAVIERYEKQHLQLADGIRERLAVVTPKTSERDTRARNLLWFDIFKICCEALGLHYREIGMMDQPGPQPKTEGYLIQCIIQDAWGIYSGEIASERAIATEIRKLKKNKAIPRKTPRSTSTEGRKRGSKISGK
ncbi:hypothetical protein [Rhizobium laguerreae]|uniref:hypothetical protein n=1 Tax=Rhizobium laguerreae TaxID=1076926 RepID=UPI001C901E38|nr:hypothetical protein [Rhizobium laguerreae]MBY3136294.1 hypothetical protein [Rhizobium laguerreae]